MRASAAFEGIGRRCRLVCLAALAAAAFASGASAESMADVPVPLQRKVACMVRVLKAIPGIDRVNVRLWTGRSGFESVNPVDNVVWVYPILEYRVRDRSGERQVLQYETERTRSSDGRDDYWFMTTLNGLTSGPQPNEWRTAEISRKWYARCRARAVALFV